jgi:hypothetical protein
VTDDRGVADYRGRVKLNARFIGGVMTPKAIYESITLPGVSARGGHTAVRLNKFGCLNAADTTHDPVAGLGPWAFSPRT